MNRKYAPDNLGTMAVIDASGNGGEMTAHIPVSGLRHLGVRPGDTLVFEKDGAEALRVSIDDGGTNE